MLTVLSLGVGQDSVALLFEIMNNEEFRIKYNIDLKEFICITAETGNEHNHTYQYRDYLESYCSSRNIPYYIIGFDNGFQSGSWTKGLISFYEKTTTVGSKVFRKTCTDNLKIKPIYRFLNYYVIERYNLIDELYDNSSKSVREKYQIVPSGGLSDGETYKMFKKNGLKLYSNKFGKINVLIGIAKGEEGRADVDNTGSKEVWMQKSINKMYPLIDMGLDRSGVQGLIKSYGEKVPMPSNCILCPFMSLQELLWLYRFENSWYNKWVELEAAKLNRFKNLEGKNMGVWGTKTLPEVLETAISKYGHFSDDELNDYKMSHGHCVKSKY